MLISEINWLFVSQNCGRMAVMKALGHIDGQQRRLVNVACSRANYKKIDGLRSRSYDRSWRENRKALPVSTKRECQRQRKGFGSLNVQRFGSKR